jgi:hypothetical protein
MFDAYCERSCGRVLVPARHIVRLDRSPVGLVASFRCWCGATGTAVFRRPADPQARLGPVAEAPGAPGPAGISEVAEVAPVAEVAS